MKKKTWIILITVALLGIIAILFFVLKSEKEAKTYKINKTTLTPIKETLTVNIARYEKDLFSLDTDQLANEIAKLYGKYPEELIQNGIWENPVMIEQLKLYLTDPIIREIYNETMIQYSDLTDLVEELKTALAHYVYYYPDAPTPNFYTLVPGIDFTTSPVFEVENNVFINLDMYLGVDYVHYVKYGIPLYIRERMEKKYILPDCFEEAIVYRHLPKKRPETLLDHIILEGKKLYFTQQMLPETPESKIIGYSDQKYAWAEKYQYDVWNHIIASDHLFSKSEQDISPYINESPFTKPFSNESPGRLGRFIGWEIVKAYMNKNRDISLDELMQNTDSKAILNQSGYKPSRR